MESFTFGQCTYWNMFSREFPCCSWFHFHTFIQQLKFFFTIYFMPGAVVGTRDGNLNKTESSSPFAPFVGKSGWRLTLQFREKCQPSSDPCGLQQLRRFRTSVSSKLGFCSLAIASKRDTNFFFFFWNDLFEARLVAEIELWNSITVLFHLTCLKLWNCGTLISSLCGRNFKVKQSRVPFNVLEHVHFR